MKPITFEAPINLGDCGFDCSCPDWWTEDPSRGDDDYINVSGPGLKGLEGKTVRVTIEVVA